MTETQQPGKNPVVSMSTSMGDVRIEIFADRAPITAKNFLDYVNDKFYDGLIFHRIWLRRSRRSRPAIGVCMMMSRLSR